MRGFVTDPAGEAGVRLVDDLPEPEPAADELVLEVRAYAINPGEVKLIARRPTRWRPGQDVAGVVLRGATDGSGPAVGSRVAAMVDGESWGERVRVPTTAAALVDERVSFEQAAALPCAGLTALRALRLGGALVGAQVLVTGATGGVGHLAVQLAALAGAYVTALVSSPARAALAQQFGAHRVVTSLNDDTLPRFDLILDGIAGPALQHVVQLVKPGGTAVVYGSAPHSRLEVHDLYGHGVRNARLIVGFVSYLPEETKAEDTAILARLAADGRLHPHLGWHTDWTQTPAALAALSERTIRGRAVLTRS